MKKIIFTITVLILSIYADEGETVFKKYCWGCHHQSAEAFGPSFSEIAKKRTYEEIQAYIIDPESMYKSFGYKRTVMTKLKLSDKEREDVAKYVISFKEK